MRRSKETTKKSSLSFPTLLQDHTTSVNVLPTNKNPHTSSFDIRREKAKPKISFAPKDLFQKLSEKRNDRSYEPSDSTNTVVKAFGITPRQFKRLRRKFRRIDINNSGTISRNELFSALEEEQTPVTDAFFKLMDSGEKGKIDFDDFLKVCLTYCIYSRKDILKFCFYCFDTDSCKL
jgi:Ca2+-binding EF-hand superfamily protein